MVVCVHFPRFELLLAAGGARALVGRALVPLPHAKFGDAQPRQPDAHEHHRQQTDAGKERLLDPFLLCVGGACNIHVCFVFA